MDSTDPKRTRAEPYPPGATYHLTHRVAGRLRRLRPGPFVTVLLKFVLAYAALKYGIKVHAACFNTNHEHLVVTDPKGNLPDFMQLLHSLIARALNTEQNRREAFWSSEPYTRVQITTREALLQTLTYVTTNPVKDGLVSTPERWPGFLTLPSQIGTTLKFSRPPSAFFGGNTRNNDPLARPSESTLPSTVSLEVALPSAFYGPDELHLYKTDYQRAVDNAVAEITATKTQRAESLGYAKPFMGRKAVLAIEPLTPAGPLGPSPRKRPSKFTGEGDSPLRPAPLALWRESYVLAREHWGQPDKPHTHFPPAAWFLPQRYNAPVVNRRT